MAPNLAEFILDRAYSAVVSMDEDGLVTAWNPSAEAIFGRRREEALGRPVAELIIPERMRAAHREGLRRFLATGEGRVLERRLELQALRADGTEFPVEFTISPLEDEGRWSFHAFVRDVSERVEADRERERLVEELNRALHWSERRFEAIVGSLSDAITIRDQNHRFLYANPAAVAHLGFGSWEELRDTAPDTIMSDFAVSGEDGREISMADIPSVRILRGESAEPLLIRTVHRETHVVHWNLLKSAPLLAEDGEIEATITIIEDVTEQKRAEQRSAFLAQASEILASSLDYEQTLRNVAELAVPEVADWCAVDLVDDDGDRVKVAVAHVNPERLSLAEELRAYEPERLDPNQGLGYVFRTGDSLLYPEIPPEMLVAAAVDEHHMELIRAVGLHSALVVPMRIGARTLGAVTLVTSESRRSLDAFDLQLAEQVAARAAVAIENSRLYSQRSSIARTLQQSLLPEQLPEIPDFELASVYLPAMQGSLVGGDFYDVWSVGESWMAIIGDVTGKGVEAAALTALVRYTMRTAAEFLASPAELLAQVDATLKHRSALSVCTALCLRLDGDRATIAVGGHPLPLYITGDGVTKLGEHGPLLGAFTEAVWEDTTVELAPGSTLVAYTDGITDAVDEERRRFGIDRLQDALRDVAGRTAVEVAECLTGALAAFQTGSHADDTAAIVLHRPVPAAAPVSGGGRESHDDRLAGVRHGQTD
ncbi:MAG TPA: SpoIIE family protein phosphatase [Solirubrobacteraceae bacterium]|jgi:PAS domain S-box-containing protein|nr:SpoIIE family protein phosphatase [Solirubrobacteraceae bacterium]